MAREKLSIVLDTLCGIADWRENLETFWEWNLELDCGCDLTGNLAGAIRHLKQAEQCLYNELHDCYNDRNSGTQEDSSSEQCEDSL